MLNGTRQLDTRRQAELAEHVAQVRLHRLLAEEQLGGDLGIRLAVDDQSRDLEFARGERRQAVTGRVMTAPPAMVTSAESPQLPLCLVAVPEGAARVEHLGRGGEVLGGTVVLACRRERAAGEDPGAARVDAGADPVCCTRVAPATRQNFVQIDNTICPLAGLLCKPSDGLEPSTPSLPSLVLSESYFGGMFWLRRKKFVGS